METYRNGKGRQNGHYSVKVGTIISTSDTLKCRVFLAQLRSIRARAQKKCTRGIPVLVPMLGNDHFNVYFETVEAESTLIYRPRVATSLSSTKGRTTMGQEGAIIF